MNDVRIMKDSSEVMQYDNSDIPLTIDRRILSEYTDMKALCHWHKDIEVVLITDGEMFYDINGKKILLKKDDIIIVNSQQLHFGYSNNRHECKFLLLIFHPELLNCNPKMYKNYVIPIIENSSFLYLHIKSVDSINSVITEILLNADKIKLNNEPAYEYEITGLLHKLWNVLYKNYTNLFKVQTEKEEPDITIQKKMVSFIYSNYTEAITLDEIASSGNISRSKCCKIFKKYLQQSPIDFLNAYRLELSKNLLITTSYSIAQIATSCGYNHLSYYSKAFQDKYKCSPSEFRKQKI